MINCPLDQWNETLLNEYGYVDKSWLLQGLSSGDLGLIFVDREAQLNLTLEELVGKVTNFDVGSPELFGYRNEEDIDVNYEIRFKTVLPKIWLLL